MNRPIFSTRSDCNSSSANLAARGKYPHSLQYSTSMFQAATGIPLFRNSHRSANHFITEPKASRQPPSPMRATPEKTSAAPASRYTPAGSRRIQIPAAAASTMDSSRTAATYPAGCTASTVSAAQ